MSRTPGRARDRDGGRGGAGGDRGGRADVVAGRNAVLEALRAGVPASTLHVLAAHDERVGEALRLARARGLAVRRVPRADLDRLAGDVPHQGVVLRTRAFAYADPADLPVRAGDAVPLVVALDGVTDPHNVGAVVRSAVAFGAHGVLLPERRAAGVTPAAWKASAGAAALVPVARAVNLTRQLRAYRGQGLFVVGLDGNAAMPLPDSGLLAGPLVLVVGAEGRGLSRLVREACDETVRIPIDPAAESLNVSVAAGVALYEVARRRAARS